ncbi:MAG TPA: type I methionyl aminopeptidase [Patescibacteria group bacterium]
MTDKIHLKTEQEMIMMKEGGAILAKVKKAAAKKVVAGASAYDVEEFVTDMIEAQGAESSFKKVPGYSWSTCINVNDGVVHGIPRKDVVFKEGDVVSVDLGVYYKGFHTDTALTVVVGKMDSQKQFFLEAGKRADNAGIKVVKEGRTVGDISEAIEESLKKAGLKPIKSLTGHGVGRELHEAPSIPNFVSGSPDERVVLKKGMVLAVEVMYTAGQGEITMDKDGWTLRTRDGKIAGLFEETVAITGHGPIVLTA